MYESHAENQVALTFRAASRADVADAVPLIYSSGPAAFDYVFNNGGTRDAQAFLRFAYHTVGASSAGGLIVSPRWAGRLLPWAPRSMVAP